MQIDAYIGTLHRLLVRGSNVRHVVDRAVCCDRPPAFREGEIPEEQITGSADLYTSAIPRPYSYFPKDMSAVALADGRVTSSFLTVFGRSARVTGMENERVNQLAPTQWLQILNSTAIQRKLQRSPKLAALIGRGDNPNEITEGLYLTILSRFPTDDDVRVAKEHAKTGATRGRDVWVDLTWALINSPEFLLRH